MSKKRTSPEPSEDKETNDGSDSTFQQGENSAKRAKQTTLSDTTLQDLPREVIEGILVKAIAMEVIGMSPDKSLWKAMADPVISRLGTVSAQWSTILSSNFFRNELGRAFDAQKTIRLEILQKFPLHSVAYATLALKDEWFLLCASQDYIGFAINVHDRNNTTVLKDVISLQGIQLTDIGACSVSNCLYVLESSRFSVWRIARNHDQQFHTSPLISKLRRKYETLAVTANGNLVLSWRKTTEERGVISVYDPNGQLQHETWLSADICRFPYKAFPKSNGNFVLVSTNQTGTKLTEIDMIGTVQRQYQSSIRAVCNACQANRRGRFLIFDRVEKFELLDAEFNVLEFTGSQIYTNQFLWCSRMDYNRERNEVAMVANDIYGITTFQFTEE